MSAVDEALETVPDVQDYDPGTDPRTKPELVRVLRELSLDARAAGPPPELDSADLDAVCAFIGEAEALWETNVYEGLPNDLDGDDDVAVVREETTIKAADGFEIELRIHRPADSTGTLPGVIYYHGGGMTMISAFNKVHQRWCHDLAASGMVAIGVNFRNAYHPEGIRPFPTGLEDCFTALRWVDENREKLGIGSLIVIGESGGANLALAVTLMAKREGELDRIDGVYAQVPYISCGYGWDDDRKRRELPSLVDLEGYFISIRGNEMLAEIYDPGGRNSENPLCWPYHATVEELAGLPPHVIVVNELDPLSDEGIAYFRKLQRAGVPAVGRVNLGLIHAAEMIFRQAVSEDYFATIGDINRFGSSL
ncbi:MAG: alpha/beta hydrolase fold domain-containing protein [Actinobacteria bacterium]|nr:alpha/beta hydrolase fold domain-containing protein [Actinomycetota bacterium]